MKLYSLNKTQLGKKILSLLNSNNKDSNLKIDCFKDGEFQPVFLESIRDEDVYIIVDGNTPDDIIKLFLTVDASKRSGANAINVVYPYKFSPIGNRLFNNILEYIGVSKIIIIDVSNDTEIGFFTIPLSNKSETQINTEYSAMFDSNIEIEGNLFYSINKSNLAKRFLATTPNYNHSDDYFSITESENRYFPIFSNKINGRNITIIADGYKSTDILKLLVTIDLAKKLGAKSISVMYPYMPYMRQDKLKGSIRSSISIRTLIDMLESVGMTRLITIELHTGCIMGMASVPVIHLNGNKIFANYIKSLAIPDMCICPPDGGAGERNKDMAKAFPHAVTANIEKTRIKFNEIAKMILIGKENILNKNIIIVDDILDTAKTSKISTTLLKDNGALSIRYIITHFVASDNALENIYNSPIDELIISDSVSGTYEKIDEYNRIYTKPNEFGILPKITIISCADFLVESNIRLNNHRSINELNVVS